MRALAVAANLAIALLLALTTASFATAWQQNSEIRASLRISTQQIFGPVAIRGAPAAEAGNNAGSMPDDPAGGRTGNGAADDNSDR